MKTVQKRKFEHLEYEIHLGHSTGTDKWNMNIFKYTHFC